MRVRIRVSAAIFLLSALVGFSPLYAQDIVIGAISARTGDNAALGEMQGNGAKIAVEEINAAGGILGKKLVLALEDSQGVPAQAVAALNKLVYRDRVVAVIGDSQSSPCLAMLPVILKAQIPMLPHGTNPSITKQGNPWIFRTRANDAVKFGSLGDFLVNKDGFKRMAVLHDSADYGIGGMAALRTTLSSKSNVLVAEESWTPGDKDFSSQLLKIKKAEPDVLVLIGPMVDMGLAMKQARQMGITAQFAGGAGIEASTTLGAAGGAGEGLIFAAGFISANPDPRVVSFVQKFTALYGKKPDDFAATGYDSVYLVAEAIKAAKSTKAEEIKKALSTLVYKGIEGTFAFDDSGEGLHSMQFGTISNGQPAFYTPSKK
ncbi:MAG: ABC transporter substrate-binding protein [Rectinema sp.]